MHKNAIWVAFLLIVMGFGIWFVVKAGYELIHYYQLSAQIPVKIEKWEVKEQEANKYIIEAFYAYEFEGKNYRNRGRVGSTYPNPWAANRARDQFEEERWYAWINPQMPQNALLEKKFPYRAAVSAVVLLGLVIYFICLGLYVGVKNEQRRE
ncbi:MAG: DUF3592 domain-containing protein [Chlamydiales bacterium]|nr:DUF3592 domain-containing protein [Chlamydiales bacterium]